MTFNLYQININHSNISCIKCVVQFFYFLLSVLSLLRNVFYMCNLKICEHHSNHSQFKFLTFDRGKNFGLPSNNLRVPVKHLKLINLLFDMIDRKADFNLMINLIFLIPHR